MQIFAVISTIAYLGIFWYSQIFKTRTILIQVIRLILATTSLLAWFFFGLFTWWFGYIIAIIFALATGLEIIVLYSKVGRDSNALIS